MSRIGYDEVIINVRKINDRRRRKPSPAIFGRSIPYIRHCGARTFTSGIVSMQCLTTSYRTKSLFAFYNHSGAAHETGAALGSKAVEVIGITLLVAMLTRVLFNSHTWLIRRATTLQPIRPENGITLRAHLASIRFNNDENKCLVGILKRRHANRAAEQVDCCHISLHLGNNHCPRYDSVITDLEIRPIRLLISGYPKCGKPSVINRTARCFIYANAENGYSTMPASIRRTSSNATIARISCWEKTLQSKTAVRY